MTMRYLLPLLLIAGCGPIPVQMQSSKQEQTQRQSNEQTQSADQQSAHQSESKQGTNSMPVIIICNSNNSPNSTCATPREGGALNDVVDSKLRRKVQ
jgi:hypothetical protein